MKTNLLTLILAVVTITAVFSQTQKTNKPAPKVELYYFHPTERCPIDQSIEDNTRALMQESFSKEVKSGTIKFMVLNTDDKATEKITANFDINAQALYLVKNGNGKPVQTDLTSFAFDYGKSNPPKFKMKLKEMIQEALK